MGQTMDGGAQKVREEKNNNNSSSIRYPPGARYGLFYLILAASLWVTPFYS